MPPVALLRRQLKGIKRHNNRLTAIALPNDFDAVGGMLAGGQVSNETSANPPPARFFAVPLNPAAGPGQLLAIIHAAAGANDSIG